MGDVGKAKQGNTNYRWSIDKDFNNPACIPYMNKPMSALSEPTWTADGGTCWHIFTHRKYEDDIKLPLTKESYEDSESLRYWQIFFLNLGIYSLLVTVAFGLIFIAYKIGRWIYVGFKKAK